MSNHVQYVPTQPDDEDRLRTKAHCAGPRVWPLRVSADHHPVTPGGVAGESQTCGADLAAGQGLKVPQTQPKRARLWLADGSCIRRRAEYPNYVWSYDFVMTALRMGGH